MFVCVFAKKFPALASQSCCEVSRPRAVGEYKYRLNCQIIFFRSGIINLLFDGLAYNTSGNLAHCSYFSSPLRGLGKILRNSQNISTYYMLNHRIRCIYWTSTFWSIDSCQNREPADQYYLTVSRTQVSTHRSQLLFWSYPLTSY